MLTGTSCHRSPCRSSGVRATKQKAKPDERAIGYAQVLIDAIEGEQFEPAAAT
jgi:hypothetical protein